MGRKRWLRWLMVPLIILTLAGAGFAVWALNPPAPMAEAMAAIRPGDDVRVDAGSWLSFQPVEGPARSGLILYPGGRVDPRAYAPLARLIAMQGHLVVIPPMPLNMAVFAPERAAAMMKAYPEVQRWVVGGHSLGGAMAARYALRHPDQVAGLLLLAAYPASSDDLSRRDLPVLVVSGSEDGLATPAKIEAARPLLPSDARWLVITGGNHAQFGWYGPQAGDRPATLSREEQQAQVAQAVTDFMALVEGR